MKIAFVTCNSIGSCRPYDDGWHREGTNEAFLIQNTEGKGIPDTDAQIGVNECIPQIEIYWQELRGMIPELDHIVIYVERCSQNAISLVHGVSSDKVSFVLYESDLPSKIQLIKNAGLGASALYRSDCGGHATMVFLFEYFLQDGSLPESWW